MLILYLEVHIRMDLVFFQEILIIFKLRFQSSMKELFFFIIFRVNILQVLEHIWFFVFLSLLFQLNPSKLLCILNDYRCYFWMSKFGLMMGFSSQGTFKQKLELTKYWYILYCICMIKTLLQNLKFIAQDCHHYRKNRNVQHI